MIAALREQLSLLENKATITPEQLANEVQVLYPDILSFSFGQSEEINVKTQEKQKIPVLNVSWRVEPNAVVQLQFTDWMKARLNAQTIKIINEFPKL